MIDNEEQTFADPIPNVCLRVFSYKQAHDRIILGNTTLSSPQANADRIVAYISVKS